MTEFSNNNKIESRLSNWILNNRLIVLALSFLIFAASAYGAKFLDFSTDYRIFFGPDNPQLLAYNKVEETFTKSDNIFFLIDTKDGKVFSKKNLAVIEELTEAGWQIPFSYRVDSITNFQHTKAENDNLLVDNLTAFAVDDTDSSYQELESIAMNEPAVAHRLISEHGKVTGVNVNMQYPLDNPTAVNVSAEYAQNLRAEFQKNIRISIFILPAPL